MQQLPDNVSQVLIHLQQRHRAQRLANFVELNKSVEKGGILFIGDSITEGFPIHEMLKCGKAMYNRGIGGDKTQDVLNLMKDIVYDLEPAKVFLLIGTNDLGFDIKPPAIVERIKEIVTNIQQQLPETKLYLQSIYPVNQSYPASQAGLRNNHDIQRINVAIREIASKDQIAYIDLYPKLIDGEGLLHDEYTYDGLHLTIKGYEVVREEIQKYL
ncbi:SGNH/GDSL hydrolase family protein [Paenibacillus sp. LHD-38]|uniref:SGNH/GDSL hydrolase family protein n=1 Tax=Paenibacillus sp. LHD-38 TaxID=3072143 RepID=UPI0028103C91|nr:SGNH/GDSL hydrolase family protein [Paenibacillus sp. LHD-38]MDQ8735619.1 SGNH/GDSL hydrolase family protein [Paenibacillus sp. LHD-38]